MSLLYWLPLINDVHNQGLTNATFTSNNITFANNGKLGKSASFNGSNSAIYTDGVSVGNQWTACFWAKMNNAGMYGLFHLGKSASYTGSQCYIHTASDNTKQFYRICNGSSWKATMDVDYTTWVHYCMTYDGNKCIIYINGTKLVEQTVTYALISGTRLSIGSYYSSTLYANGMIQDVRLYDNVLSPREVKEISKGLVLHYPLSAGGAENLIHNSATMERNIWVYATNSSLITEDGVPVAKLVGTTENWTGTVATPYTTSNTSYLIPYSVVRNKTVTFSCYIKSSVPTTYKPTFSLRAAGNSARTRYYFPPDNWDYTTEWKRFSVTDIITDAKFTRGSGTVSETDYFFVQLYNYNDNITQYTKGWKLEINDHATPWIPNSSDSAYSTMGYDDGIEYDVSGYGNNATKVGTIAASGDTPRYSTSSSFDGSSYIINNTSTIHLSNEFTIAWWGKINTWLKKWEGMFILQNTTALNGANGTFSIGNALHASNADKMSLTIRQGGTTYPFDHYNWTYTIDEWAHYALTYNKGTIIMYQNGKSVYTSTIEDTSSTDYYYAIGHRLYKSDCQISDFRVYNTVLSQEDIQSIYNTPLTLSNNGVLLTQGELSEV